MNKHNSTYQIKTSRLILFFNLLILFTSCNGQESKRSHPKSKSIADTLEHFVIGNYMIVPNLKEIRNYKRIGGVNWDGYEYEKDPKIDYEKTTLLALGDRIFFKEYFPFDFDLNKLKIIYRDDFYALCKDGKNIYYTSIRIKPTKIDISSYEQINDLVYKSKSGALFFVDIECYQLTPIGIDVDENSIKHLLGNYYFDKNGLYFFGEHYKKNSKGYYDDYVEKSEKLVSAQNITPLISKKYFCFNKQVFALDGNKIKGLNIDVEKIIEVNIGASGSFITDGKSIYSDSNYGFDESERNGKGYYGIWYPTFYSGINLQKIFNPFLNFQKEKNSVVFNKTNPNNSLSLIAKINNENYLLLNKKKIKIDKLLFYHPETKTTDTFDEKYLKIYTDERFIQYKNVLYFDGIPVETAKLNMKNLTEIENSNYLTDGKSLFYIGNINGYSSSVKNGVEYAVFDDRILENIFIKEMKPINRDLLSDGITLVSKAQQIKISALNLNVKIVK